MKKSADPTPLEVLRAIAFAANCDGLTLNGSHLQFSVCGKYPSSLYAYSVYVELKQSEGDTLEITFGVDEISPRDLTDESVRKVRTGKSVIESFIGIINRAPKAGGAAREGKLRYDFDRQVFEYHYECLRAGTLKEAELRRIFASLLDEADTVLQFLASYSEGREIAADADVYLAFGCDIHRAQ